MFRARYGSVASLLVLSGVAATSRTDLTPAVTTARRARRKASRRVLEATSHGLSQLPDGAQALLHAAAAAGNGFSVGVVTKVLDRPVLALLDAVDACQRLGFLVVGDRPCEHRFEGAALGQYDQVQKELGLSPGGKGAAPECLFHWITEAKSGIRVTDVWKSREAFGMFAEEVVGPVTEKLGYDWKVGDVAFHEVHD